MAPMLPLLVITAILFNYTTEASVYSDHTTSPTILYRGDMIESTSKKTALAMQLSDGNLVLFNVSNNGETVIWSAHTTNATYTQITNDGNIISKDDDGNIYWSSNSGGYNATEYHLVVMDFCAYLMDTHYTVLWSTCDDECNVIYPTFAAPTYDGDTHAPSAQPTISHIDHIIIPQNDSFILHADKRIYSLSMSTLFRMQTGGNAVLYRINDECEHEVIYSTKTRNTGAEYLEFNSDGNIMVTDSNHTIYWQSNSGGNLASAPHTFTVIDHCAYLANRYYSVLWSIGNCNCSDAAFEPPTIAVGSPTGAPTPKPTPIYMDHLSTKADQSLFLYPLDRITSLSLATYAIFQEDGNFVLYVNDKYGPGICNTALWSTKTAKTSAQYVELKPNGNMRVMGNNDDVLWTTSTNGHISAEPQHLVVTDECMYLMDSNYDVYWSEGSGCNNNFPTFSPPTISPTVPTISPTMQPITVAPTQHPTAQPTIEPTIFPSFFPTLHPIKKPTKFPTLFPSSKPTKTTSLVLVPSQTFLTIESSYDDTEKEEAAPSADYVGYLSIWIGIAIVIIASAIAIAVVYAVVACLWKGDKANMDIDDISNHKKAVMQEAPKHYVVTGEESIEEKCENEEDEKRTNEGDIDTVNDKEVNELQTVINVRAVMLGSAKATKRSADQKQEVFIDKCVDCGQMKEGREANGVFYCMLCIKHLAQEIRKIYDFEDKPKTQMDQVLVDNALDFISNKRHKNELSEIGINIKGNQTQIMAHIEQLKKENTNDHEAKVNEDNNVKESYDQQQTKGAQNIELIETNTQQTHSGDV